MTNERYKAARKVTVISAITNTTLAIIKIIIGYLGHSQALIADGLHSFSDLLSDGLVLLAAKAGGQEPDKEHPYGHQRIETIAAIIIAIILIAVAVTIVYDSLHHALTHQVGPTPDIAVLIAATISIFANEGLYRYNLFVGKKIHSNLLITNAWHNRSDALTSIIVLISAIGAMIGFHYLDEIGAIIIGLLILKMGIQMMWGGVKELIDTGVDEKTLAKIVTEIEKVSGVVSIHQLRTRLHGGSVFVDVHILVNPFISVSEGHHISEEVHLNLLHNIDEVADVTVHIDPEDDETSHPCSDLPNREALMQQLHPHWSALPGFAQIEKITLHYLDGRLHIDIRMAENAVPYDERTSVIRQYKEAVSEIDGIAEVDIHFRHPH